MGQNLMGAANAQAAGTVGSANAWSGALGSLTQTGTQYGMLAAMGLIPGLNSPGGTPYFDYGSEGTPGVGSVANSGTENLPIYVTG